MNIQSAYALNLTPTQFDRLFNIIRIAYAETEKEVWGEGYVRVSRENLKRHIKDDEILIALLDDEIVGGIRFYEKEPGCWTFGLLGADFEHKGKGIGRTLIAAAESKAKEAGGTEMSIEILRAKDIDTDFKVNLANWYQRLGYEFTGKLDVMSVYADAEKWAKLVNPSEFDCYVKRL
jgi:GNAT superfamily N-acetyltransferase